MAETPSKAGARGAAAPAHGEARARLLAAASRLFAQHGFEGVSVRDIAAEAGVGHAGVNYHFRSKSELYKEVLRKHGPGAAMARAGVAPHSPAGEDPSVRTDSQRSPGKQLAPLRSDQLGDGDEEPMLLSDLRREPVPVLQVLRAPGRGRREVPRG